MQAPCPNLVHSTKVHNTTQSVAYVTVFYDDHANKAEVAEAQGLQAGESHTFPPKILDMGSSKVIIW